jgi:hypothetical protein
LWLHHPELVLDPQQRSEHIGVKRRGIALRGDLGVRDHVPVDSGVVDRDIQAAEPLHRRVDDPHNLGFMPDVSGNELDTNHRHARATLRPAPRPRPDDARTRPRWHPPRRTHRGELRPDADAEQLTYALMAALQGGMLLSQTARDIAPLQAALASVLECLRSYAS